jgi:dTDP-4-dehydrorhamnose reductase
MKFTVTGAGGLLGTEFVAEGRRVGHEVIGLGHQELDVTDLAAVRRRMSAESGTWVVHCAAYTAVDRAESEPNLACGVNREGSRNVAIAATEAGARMVYMSTDYVFDGRKTTPYLPTDGVGPASVYGRTKLEGERAVLEAAVGWPPLVVRTGWLYGAGGRNFVQAILERAERGEPLQVVADQRGRPTWARNVARTVLELMDHDTEGAWHVADAGDATWLELAREALALAGSDTKVEGVSSAAWGAAAPRPAYSVLDLSATELALGRSMEPWPEALARFLEERGHGGRQRGKGRHEQ